MDFLFPLAAIVSENFAKTVDKLNFVRNRIAARQLMLLIFIVMSFSLLLYVTLTKQPFPKLSLISISLISLITMTSFASNVFSLLSLKVNDLSLREPMGGFHHILAGLVGYVLFPAERKPQFLAIFIASIFIMRYGTHQRKLRNFQIKGMHFFLLSIIFESLLPSFYRVTLGYISPLYITLFRVLGILTLSLFFFPLKKTFQTLNPNKVLYGCVSGVVYSVGAVVSLYAIQTLGVVQTMVLLLLAPMLRYLTCYFILKEKVRKGEVIASLLLAGMVLASIII